MHIMAGVLEQLVSPQKKAVVYRDPKRLELQVAREILAEVFGVRLSEVDEMIQSRFEPVPEACSEDDGLWPQEFWVEC
jgi:hypothetical protein